MTTTNDNKHTEELAKLNETFANRYTDEDKEYIEMTKRANSPPIVDDWGEDRNARRPQRFDNNNQRRHFSDHHRGHRNYSNDWGEDRSARRPQRFDNNNQRHHFSDHRRGHRNYSNDLQPYQTHSNYNRQYRDRSRSPHYHDKRR
jgi:hypothetical protein